MASVKGVSKDEFAREIRQYGYFDLSEIARLYEIAERCSKQAGVPVGVATGAATAGVSSVALPVIGAVPGWLAGALAGWFSGTAVCTMGNATVREGLKDLLR